MIKKYILLLIILLIPSIAFASMNTKFGIQGQVLNQTNLSQGIENLNITITIHNTTGCGNSSAIYNETFTNATDELGVYSVLIGDSINISMDFNTDYYACVWGNSTLLHQDVKFIGGHGEITEDDVNFADLSIGHDLILGRWITNVSSILFQPTALPPVGKTLFYHSTNNRFQFSDNVHINRSLSLLGNISFNDTYLIFENPTHETLLGHTTGKTYIYGGNTTLDDLYLRSNLQDTYPFIALFGGGNHQWAVGSGDKIILYELTNSFMEFDRSGSTYTTDATTGDAWKFNFNTLTSGNGLFITVDSDIMTVAGRIINVLSGSSFDKSIFNLDENGNVEMLNWDKATALSTTKDSPRLKLTGNEFHGFMLWERDLQLYNDVFSTSLPYSRLVIEGEPGAQTYITPTATGTHIAGGGTSGDTVILMSNIVDSYGRLTLSGTQTSELSISGGKSFYFDSAGSDFFKLKRSLIEYITNATTTSAWIFDVDTVTSGTGVNISADGLTTGKALSIDKGGTILFEIDGSGNTEMNGSMSAIQPSVRAYCNVSQNITNGAWNTIFFESENFDTANMHSIGSNNQTIVISENGTYLIMSQISFVSNSTGVRAIRVRINGITTLTQHITPTTTAPYGSGVSAETLEQLSIGDNVTIQGFQTSGGILDTIAGRENKWFAVTKLN